jgi:predicted nuclease with TOPRIM domain
MSEQDTIDKLRKMNVEMLKVINYFYDEYTKERDKVKELENYDPQLEMSVSQTNQIMKLEQEVSRLRTRNKYLQERLEELTPKKAVPKYDFCEIPNDQYGKAFINAIKRYLNTKKYQMRVRGQHLKEELKGRGLARHGQSIDQSTHLRVYIEEKK